MSSVLAVLDPSELLPTLKSRFPKSAHVINMVMQYKNFTLETKMYCSNKIDPDNSWIIGKYEREDAGQQFIISVPSVVTPENLPHLFTILNCKEIINWEKPYEFIGIDERISKHVIDAAHKYTQNIQGDKFVNKHLENIEVLPCYYYFADENWAPKNDEKLRKAVESGFEIKSLESKEGLEYLNSEWPYVNEKTTEFRDKLRKRCLAYGAYLKTGKVVSGGVMHPTGHIGTITNSEYRNKGLSTICMEKLANELKKAKLIPVSMVGIENDASNKVHDKIGFTQSHRCDFIFYK